MLVTGTRRPGEATVDAGGRRPPLVGLSRHARGQSVTHKGTRLTRREGKSGPGQSAPDPRPRTTNFTGPGHVDEQRSGPVLHERPGRPVRAATGTGRASGFHDRRQSLAVKASSAVRPSRPCISTAAMSLVFSCASPWSSYSTSSSTATTGTSSRLVRSAASTAEARSREPGSASYAARAAATSGVDRTVVTGEAGVRDGAHRADACQTAHARSVLWRHGLRDLGRPRPGADADRAALSFVAWRRRGLAAGLRGLSWTLLPVAAWLTGTLTLAVDIGQARHRLGRPPGLSARPCGRGIVVAGVCAVGLVVPVGRDASAGASGVNARA